MNVPLDRLYNFIDGVCNHPLIIYQWMPHGSKKPEDCRQLKDYNTLLGAKNIIASKFLFCHDQEPLCFDNFSQVMDEFKIGNVEFSVLRLMPFMPPIVVNDKVLLLHSERNSAELEKFERNGAIGVYYWSHAIVALDWFRYANIDPQLKLQTTFDHDFLVYNRAWAGTREYRLKFTELMIGADLHKQSLMTFAELDSDTHYTSHKFKNCNLALARHDLEKHLEPNTSTSSYSADYSTDDYNKCRIDVVLETLFDDERVQLTEKSLRPIACGKPFIIAGPAGSLEYLKSYGFKTYGDFIDESYDSIVDTTQRLNAIIKSMQKFSLMDSDTKHKAMQQMLEISKYNQQRFFSKEFFELIVNELKTNFNNAIVTFNETNTTEYFLRAVEIEKSNRRQFPLFPYIEDIVDTLKHHK